MSNGSTDDYRAVWVAGLSALGGFATLVVTFFWLIRGDGAVDRWQGLGMLAVSVVIAFAVTAMLRYALAPLTAASTATSAADAEAALRNRIAPIVLTIGSTAIVALAVALIISFVVLAPQKGFESLQQKIDTLITGVFGTVLPVVATWVGTVLAFYFGSENFRQAAQSTREVLNNPLTRRRRKLTDIMIPYRGIAKLEVESEEAAAAIRMLNVIHLMSEAAPRIMIFNRSTQTPIYVIRSGSPPMPRDWIKSDYSEGEGCRENSISHYLGENDARNRADALNYRFVDADSSPDDAIALMKREGVDDLFITADGQRTGRVLGWVAQRDLLES